MTIVKICGITNQEDARAAAAVGVDLLGFIFYSSSSRYVTLEWAREIASGIRETSNVRLVGVFVNEPIGHVCEVMETVGLELAQLHGKESPEMLAVLGARAYKSLQARDLDTAYALMANYRRAVGEWQGCEDVLAFIADAPFAQLLGGNGMIADWSVAREIAREFPILLAGGLNPENVHEAIDKVQFWGVDVSSGVERAPGLKDHAWVREFIARVKG